MQLFVPLTSQMAWSASQKRFAKKEKYLTDIARCEKASETQITVGGYPAKQGVIISRQKERETFIHCEKLNCSMLRSQELSGEFETRLKIEEPS